MNDNIVSSVSYESLYSIREKRYRKSIQSVLAERLVPLHENRGVIALGSFFVKKLNSSESVMAEDVVQDSSQTSVLLPSYQNPGEAGLCINVPDLASYCF